VIDRVVAQVGNEPPLRAEPAKELLAVGHVWNLRQERLMYGPEEKAIRKVEEGPAERRRFAD